jgi:hypothetical protein
MEEQIKERNFRPYVSFSLLIHGHINSSCDRLSPLQNHRKSSCRPSPPPVDDKQIASHNVHVKMTHVSSSTFLSLESAMAHPRGNEVDVVAVVGFIYPADYSLLHPHHIRELCLKDNRLIIFLCILYFLFLLYKISVTH